MTYELGRAQFILDANNGPLLEKEAIAFSIVTNNAKNITEIKAKQLGVQEKDIRASASILIDIEKKLAAEQVKIQKEQARQAERDRKTRLDGLKADIRQEVRELKAREAAQKDYERQLKAFDKERDDQAKAELKRIQQQIDAQNRLNKSVVAPRPGQGALTAGQQQVTSGTSSRSNQSGSILGYNPRGIGGDIATIAGFGAIASGAILVREALVGLREATLKQEQAQRALNAAFGDTQILYKSNADALAQQFGLISSTVEQATTRFAVLRNQTVLTGEQIRGLNKVAIENQAAFGGDLLEAHRSLAGAILGETEAYEKYGVVLQEGVLKSSEKLTEDEKRRFTTMSESEKQMIRYRIIMEEAAKVTGSAAQRAKDAQGGFDALNRSADELAKTLGGALVKEFGELARGIGGATSEINKFIQKYLEYKTAREQVESRNPNQGINSTARTIAGLLPASLAPGAPQILDFIIDSQRIAELRTQVDANRSDAARKDRDAKELANIKEHLETIKKAKQDAQDREESDLKAAQTKLEHILKEAHDTEIKRLDDEIKAAEAAKTYRLRALEEGHKAELVRLDDQENARKRASELELARIQEEKDKALQAATDRKDTELERIETVKEASQAAAEQTIRNLEIEREARKRTNEDTRDTVLAQSKSREEAELTRLELFGEERKGLRIKEDREIAASIQTKERQLDDDHKKTLRRLEREGEELRRNSDKQDKGVENRAQKEDDNHRKKLRQIDTESDAELKLLDDQIKAIDEVQRAREAARRRSGLTREVSDAELRLREATGSQDPAARAAAQQKLVGAIRIGDPTAIKKAQEELTEIVGRGTKAIGEAQRDLSDKQQDLRDNDLKETEDAEKRKLQATKERVSAQKDIDQRAEEDRNRSRTQSLEKDKKADRDKLADALHNLELRQEREDDANVKAKRQLDDVTAHTKDQLEDRRRSEDLALERSVEATRKTYEQETIAERARYDQEQRDITDTYDGEAYGYIPAVRRALARTIDDYKTQTEQANNRYKAEQLDIYNTYDDPVRGLIAHHRQMEADAINAYQAVVRTVTTEYENARRAVSDAYNAPDGKSGIIDKLQVAKDATDAKLAEITTSFRLHKDGLVGANGIIKVQWDEAIKQAEAYFKYIDDQNKKRGGTGVSATPTPGNTNPGGASTYPGSGGDVPGQGTTVGSAPAGTPFLKGKDDNNPYGNRPTGKYAFLQDANISVELGSVANSVAPGIRYEDAGVTFNQDKIREWIVYEFTNRINSQAAQDALQVYHGEGETGYVGDSGTSFGPFQLNVNGLGGAFIKQTGLDPRLPSTVPEQVAWVADYVKKNGWNKQWHGAPGYDRKHPENSSGISIRKYDMGHLFDNPTIFQDMRTGDKGVLAERGPERLLGRRDTQAMQSMGVSRIAGNGRASAIASLDYTGIGANGVDTRTVAETINNVAGDTMVYNGVAPEDVIKKWRSDQRKQRVLRGVRKIG